MTEQEAVRIVKRLGYEGKPVACTKDEYETVVRSTLHGMAAHWIDQGLEVRAVLALEEVKRLDALFT